MEARQEDCTCYSENRRKFTKSFFNYFAPKDLFSAPHKNQSGNVHVKAM
jgi:hypothetical protein